MATFEESVETFLGHYEELTRSLETDDGFFKEFMVRGGVCSRNLAAGLTCIVLEEAVIGW